MSLSVDIVIPTYNRAAGLRALVDSIFAADLPESVSRRVIVANNNSTDDTEAVCAGLASKYESEFVAVRETTPGSSAARNAGARLAEAEIIAFIDDDELMEAGWFRELEAAFRNPRLDFVSGPYLPLWEAEPPAWLPVKNYPAVIGWIELSDEINKYTPQFGEIMAGNLALRRAVFEDAGGFDIRRGRAPDGSGTGEDRALQFELLKRGRHGEYRPALKVFHRIPESRMRKSYFVKWVFANSVGLTRQVEKNDPFAKPTSRWMYGKAAAGLRSYVFGPLRGLPPSQRFAGLLEIVSLSGRLWGAGLNRFDAVTRNHG